VARIETLLGPPGTGKTTTLLNRIEALLSAGVRPEEIAFVSFTKAATQNAIDRAASRFDIDPAEFAWFKTIHAMARRAMGEKIAVMGDADWKAFGELCAYSFTAEEHGGGIIADGSFDFSEDGDCLRNVYKLSRNMRGSIAEARLHAGDVPPHLTAAHFESFIRRLSAWKTESKMIDFEDMLERARGTAWRPPIRFAFIDEAQDNSKLQNSLMRHWFWDNSRCESVTYAGDDDQTIFGWSGAQRGALKYIAEHSDLTILDQSYRIPRTVHDLALSIISQNKNRVPKTYRPRDDEGSLAFAGDPSDAIDSLGDGDTLVLVRNVMFAKAAREACLRNGRLFSSEVGAWSPLDRKDIKQAFGAICSWQDGKNASAAEFASLIALVPVTHGEARLLPHGIKKRSKENADPVPLWRAREQFKLNNTVDAFLGELPFELLQMGVTPEERAYLHLVRLRDPKLSGHRLTITSSHRSKGREADNVIVIPDMARRTVKRRFASVEGREEENNVAYVTVTRAKKREVIVDPGWREWYDYASHARRSA
jgi:DNA helicase-2/ATP-dependent DNA helicase PcrA